jgi:hypothetical protein
VHVFFTKKVHLRNVMHHQMFRYVLMLMRLMVRMMRVESHLLLMMMLQLLLLLLLQCQQKISTGR